MTCVELHGWNIYNQYKELLLSAKIQTATGYSYTCRRLCVFGSWTIFNTRRKHVPSKTTDSAVADLNVIRKRAGLGNSTALHNSSNSYCCHAGKANRTILRMGHRWFDLIRSGTINTALSAIKTGWRPAAALLPVPLLKFKRSFLNAKCGILIKIIYSK